MTALDQRLAPTDTLDDGGQRLGSIQHEQQWLRRIRSWFEKLFESGCDDECDPMHAGRLRAVFPRWESCPKNAEMNSIPPPHSQNCGRGLAGLVFLSSCSVAHRCLL